MKFLRYKTGKPEYKGILDGENVKRINGSIFLNYGISEETTPLNDITYLPPVLPNKIIGLRGNYGAPQPEPLFFLKTPNTLLGHKGKIILPENVDKVLMEGELAVVISKKCRNVPIERAESYILGYTIANDITARSARFQESFTTGKWYDTFTPLGPVIDTKCGYDNLYLAAKINGKEVQSGSTSGMGFKVPFIISYLSSVMPLEAGDVILTGTPSPAVEIKKGDIIEISISDIGTLINEVE